PTANGKGCGQSPATRIASRSAASAAAREMSISSHCRADLECHRDRMSEWARDRTYTRTTSAHIVSPGTLWHSTARAVQNVPAARAPATLVSTFAGYLEVMQ